MAKSFTSSQQGPSSSPTEVNFPTFDRIFPLKVESEGSDDELSSKLIMFTILRLLQRIETQLDSQACRLSSVERSTSMKADFLTRTSEAPLDERWGNVVSEYERSIMKLRNDHVEDGASEGETCLGRSYVGRTSGNQDVDVAEMPTQSLGVGGRDGDSYSISVYSGNILDRVLEHTLPSDVDPSEEELSAHHTIPSIKYEAGGLVHCNKPTNSTNRISSNNSTRSQHERSIRRSDQLLKSMMDVVGTWKHILASKMTEVKSQLHNYQADCEQISSQRLQEVMQRPFSILDSWRIRLLERLNRRTEMRLRKKTERSRAQRKELPKPPIGYLDTTFNSRPKGSPHFSSATLPKKMLRSFG